MPHRFAQSTIDWRNALGLLQETIPKASRRCRLVNATPTQGQSHTTPHHHAKRCSELKKPSPFPKSVQPRKSCITPKTQVLLNTQSQLHMHAPPTHSTNSSYLVRVHYVCSQPGQATGLDKEHPSQARHPACVTRQFRKHHFQKHRASLCTRCMHVLIIL
jgi:hypothetical protein